jgi:hypothetical protein
MKDTLYLPLINVSPNKIFYLQPEIEHIPRVITSVSIRMTPTSGRYNILISAGQFKQVKGIIVEKFTNIYNQVPIDAQQNPDAIMFMGSP